MKSKKNTEGEKPMKKEKKEKKKDVMKNETKEPKAWCKWDK